MSGPTPICSASSRTSGRRTNCERLQRSLNTKSNVGARARRPAAKRVAPLPGAQVHSTSVLVAAQSSPENGSIGNREFFACKHRVAAAILTYRRHHRTIALGRLLRPDWGCKRDLAHHGGVINAQHIV